MIDARTAFADELARTLPGEEILALESVMYLPGREDKALEPTQDPGDVVLEVVTGGLPTEGAEELLGGHTREAARGSRADELTRVCETGSQLVVTRRELVLLADTFSWAIRFRCPVTAVALAPAPRLFQAGRFRVAFDDGSWAMLSAGFLTGRAAARLVAAHADALARA